MSSKVLLTGIFDLEGTAKGFQAAGYETVTYFGRPSAEELVKIVPDCDAIMTGGVPISSAVIDAAPKLKVIAANSAGIEYIDIPHATEKGIWVCNAGDANSAIVAEHAMYLIMALAKRGRDLDLLCREGRFIQRRNYPLKELSTCTLGLIGCGKIASRLGAMAYHGFGMKVLCYDPFIPDQFVPDFITKLDNREDVLAQADFVSIHLQLNPQTEGSFGMEQFKQMKDSAYFINAARGPLVKEDELVEALNTGVLAGAGLDVFAVEPPAADNPLFALDNVILSPHCAPNSPSVNARMGEYSGRNIFAVLAGEKPPFPVNKIS